MNASQTCERSLFWIKGKTRKSEVLFRVRLVIAKSRNACTASKQDLEVIYILIRRCAGCFTNTWVSVFAEMIGVVDP